MNFGNNIKCNTDRTAEDRSNIVLKSRIQLEPETPNEGAATASGSAELLLQGN